MKKEISQNIKNYFKAKGRLNLLAVGVLLLLLLLTACSGEKVAKKSEGQGSETSEKVVSDKTQESDTNDSQSKVKMINPVNWKFPYAQGDYDPIQFTDVNHTEIPKGIIDKNKVEIIGYSKDVQQLANDEDGKTVINFFNTYKFSTKPVGEERDFGDEYYKGEIDYEVYVLGEATETDGKWREGSHEVFRIVKEEIPHNSSSMLDIKPADEKLSATNDSIFKDIPKKGYHLEKVTFQDGGIYLEFFCNDILAGAKDGFIKQIKINNDGKVVTNRILMQGNLTENSPVSYTRTSDGPAAYYSEKNLQTIDVYPLNGDNISFTDKYTLLYQMNLGFPGLKSGMKIFYIDLKDKKAYIGDIDLKQLDLVTGEPLYNSEGQDKVIDRSDIVYVDVHNNVLYAYGYDGIAAYDKDLNFINKYNIMGKPAELSGVVSDTEEGKFGYISSSSTSINFWNFKDFQRKPNLERVEVRYIGTHLPKVKSIDD